MTSEAERVAYNPRDVTVRDDPYPHYDGLRARCPVVHSPETGAFVVTDHRVIRDVMMDNELFSNEGATDNPFGDLRVLVTADDPAHRRHRKLIARAFTPKRIASMEGYARQIANDLIDIFIDQGSCDIVGTFAYRLPVALIAGMLGIPEDDHARFREWADDLFAVAAEPTQEVIGRAMASLGNFAQYILACAADESANAANLLGEDNVLAALRAPDEDGEILSDQEFVIATLQLLSAGHETTTNLIANGIWQLCAHPEEYQRLYDNPTLIEVAVEEILRFDSPVLYQWRRATRDTEVAGVHIPAESILEVVLAAANRDPAVWPEPNKFDLTRPLHEARQHLTFGTGIHTCLGAALARLEGKVALSTLLERIPGLRIDATRESTRGAAQFFRGWKTLYIQWNT
jgi:cytochrome P450